MPEVQLERHSIVPVSFLFDRSVKRIERYLRRYWLTPPEERLSGTSYALASNNSWTAGFYSGMLWLAYSWTRNSRFLNAARAQSIYLSGRLEDERRLDHDVGFLFLPSFAADYVLTGNEDARVLALRAAEILLRRFNRRGSFIPAWNDNTYRRAGENDWCNEGRVIIDTLMNLSLLYWAATVTGESRFSDAAEVHAETTAKWLVREDGSTFHTFEFAPADGAPIRPRTYQGTNDHSVWSRGQAWAVYGFLNTYRHTGNRRFLKVARITADYMVGRIENRSSCIPPWDLTVGENSSEPVDTSAGVILASALMDLSDYCESENGRYSLFARRLLAEITDSYSRLDCDDCEGLIGGGAGNVPAGLSGQLLPYGDFFFLEALGKEAGNRMPIW